MLSMLCRVILINKSGTMAYFFQFSWLVALAENDHFLVDFSFLVLADGTK